MIINYIIKLQINLTFDSNGLSHDFSIDWLHSKTIIRMPKSSHNFADESIGNQIIN